MNHPLIKVIEDAIQNTKLGVVKEYRGCYSCKHGRKYHVMGCYYCNEKVVRADYEQNYVIEGFKPCKCVIQAEEEEISKVLAGRESQYITAFIDESTRSNPGYYIDDDLEKKQNLISVIMCNGKVKMRSR